MSFSFFKQYDSNDCGPAALKMIVHYYGREISLSVLRNLCEIGREGVSISILKATAEKIGFNAIAVKAFAGSNESSLDIPDLESLPLPAIAHWNANHFVVIYNIKNGYVNLADPALGKYRLSYDKFNASFYKGNESFGKLILLEPEERFFTSSIESFETNSKAKQWSFLSENIKESKKGFGILVLFLCLALIIQMVTPYLTKVTFDSVLKNRDINLLIIISLIQVGIYLASSMLSFGEAIATYKVSMKINIRLTTKFIEKILGASFEKLSSNFTSDIVLRTMDLSRIESFLTFNLTSILLSSLSFVGLSVLLIYYNITIFFIYLIPATLYVLWILKSIKKKRVIDPEKFDIQVSSHNQLIEIIEGMQEIRLNGNESDQINRVIEHQKKLFKNKLTDLRITQFLSIGSGVISNLGMSLTSIAAVYMTIIEEMSLGTMAAVQLVVLQLNSSLSSTTSSFGLIQELKFSIGRILDVHAIESEVKGEQSHCEEIQEIQLKKVSFAYSTHSPNVLEDISFTIRKNTTVAIVGESGGGKTTLIKLLLGLYRPKSGEILVNGQPFETLDLHEFRRQCGVVMQDGYVFSESILNNITGFDATPNYEHFNATIQAAELTDFINGLPLKENTELGKKGLKLSGGQKQRILLAKLIYKQPNVIFLDEATNSLDYETENKIFQNIDRILGKRTRIIIAHRLNTIVNADHIIVLKNGKVIEQGVHKELMQLSGYYCHLFNSQIELI